MKKFFLYSFVAVASAIGLASCSSEELEGTSKNGKAVCEFNVQAPTGIASRSFADGTTANKLKYAVYDSKDAFLFDGETDIPLQTKVSLSLATDNTYKIVFWAQSASSPYTINWSAKTMTYEPSAATGNSEDRDAFYKEVEIKVTGNSSQTVELRRPFAQLNIGTDDVEAAKTAGLTVDQTQVTVTGVPTTLNLLDGTTSGSADVTYAYAAVPTGETFPVAHATQGKKYEYLAMNYILMPSDKQTTDVTFKFKGADEKERTYASVPLQRNYRTNIYGSLLTSTTDFNVVIKPEFETPDYDQEIIPAYTATTMDEVIAAIKAGETNIALAAGEYQIPSGFDASAGVTIESASGKASDVTVKFQPSGQQWAHNANVTFKNVTIDRTMADAYTSAIQHAAAENYENCIINGLVQIYAPSASFTNCTFNNTATGGTAAYSVYVYSNSNVVVDNCTFNSSIGKAILVYNENTAAKAVEMNLTVSNTKFSAEGTDKYVVEIHTEWGGIYGTVNVNNCTIEKGFKGLWWEGNNNDKTATKLFNINVDGTAVQTAA